MIIDCREMQNDKLVLKNPHKGWYHHFVDQGFSGNKYRDEFRDGNVLNIPGLNHLYIRFDWSDIEKEDGIFDWSPIDEVMSKYKDYKFAFRLCTYETRKGFAIPRVHYEKGIKGKFCGKQRAFEPDYNDGIYLKYLDRFMAEYAKKFNGNPQVEYIDIGTFGTWGEGHTWFGSEKIYDVSVIKKHIDLHLKHFKDTMILINDDMIRHVGFNEDLSWENRSNDRIKEVLDYCADRGIGVREDSVCVDSFADEFGFSTICMPEIFNRLSHNAPVDLELQHYSNFNKESFGNGLRYYEAMRQTNATYSGFHGYAREWLRDNSELHNHCANKLGYWYFIDEIRLPKLISGTKTIALIDYTNKGFARSYHLFNLLIQLDGKKGKFVLNTESPDNRKWNSESSGREKLILDLKDVPSGTYKLKIGMFEGKTPIKLGFDMKLLQPDGYYCICEIEVKELSI